jgi:hypothetical protein
MNRKLTLVLAGALAALAFMALTGSAAAKETKLKCEALSGACTFVIAGGEMRLSLHDGDTIACNLEEGSGSVVNLNAERESTTSELELTFKGCKEQNTAFHFSCSNTATAGNITTNVMTAHNIAIGSGTKAAVLLTNAGFTFTCAGGFASTQVTGNYIGEIETACGTNTSAVQKWVFSVPADGTQALRTYTGITFDLEGKTSHTNAESKYQTAAISSTTTLTYNQNVILTCA